MIKEEFYRKKREGFRTSDMMLDYLGTLDSALSISERYSGCLEQKCPGNDAPICLDVTCLDNETLSCLEKLACTYGAGSTLNDVAKA